MNNSVLFRRGLLLCLIIAVFVAGVVVGQKKNQAGRPASIIHVVTLDWTEDSTPEQRQKALDGIRVMGEKIPGIKNIWLKKLRSQREAGKAWDQIFVIEFANEAAANAYVDHPAHKEWEQIYQPVRKESRSHQVTN